MTVSAPSTIDATPVAPGAAPSATDSEQRFLKLLVTQLNNQDPLAPMDNVQLTSQLAQMSTVSGIEKMNAALQSLLAQSDSAQALQAAALVGRTVLAPGHALRPGDGFAIELPAAAGSVRAVVSDATGRAVRTLDLGALPAGTHPLGWDELDDAGRPVAPGVYSLAVSAADGGTAVPATALVFSDVVSVTQDARGCRLDLADGGSVLVADVRMLR